MSNTISFIGRLGGDAELKQVGESSVSQFSIANNVGFGDKKTTNWFRCSLWGKQGEAVNQYLKKGKQVFISGELKFSTYTKDGSEKQSNDIRVGTLELISSNDSEGQATPASIPVSIPVPMLVPGAGEEDEPW